MVSRSSGASRVLIWGRVGGLDIAGLGEAVPSPAFGVEKGRVEVGDAGVGELPNQRCTVLVNPESTSIGSILLTTDPC